MKIKRVIAMMVGFCLLLSLVQFKPAIAEGDEKLSFESVTVHHFAGGPNFGTKLENVYDGNNTTFANYAAYKAGDKYRDGTYFLFDLGKVCDISKFTVYFPNPVRVHNFAIYTSVDNILYTKGYEFTEKEYGENGSEFVIEKAVQARYVKVMALGAYVKAEGSDERVLNENFHFGEFAVYGKEATEVVDNRIEIAEVTANNFASGPNFGQILENLTDGNVGTSTNYAPKKGDGKYIEDPHFLFDLGDLYDLENVALVFPHPSGGRIHSFDILISQDNENFEKVYGFESNTHYGHDGFCGVSIEGVAQYIKFVAVKAINNGTSLSDNYQVMEFVAYGTKYVEPTEPPTEPTEPLTEPSVEKITIVSGKMEGFSDNSPVEGTKIENAFDGNNDSLLKVIGHVSDSGNKLGDDAYFTFDLGSVFELEEIQLNFGTVRSHFYKILVSTDGENFNEVKSYTEGEYEKTGNYYIRNEGLGGTKARYVRVVAYGTVASPGNQYYMLNEISLYGSEATEVENPQTNDIVLIVPIFTVLALSLSLVQRKRKELV